MNYPQSESRTSRIEDGGMIDIDDIHMNADPISRMAAERSHYSGNNS